MMEHIANISLIAFRMRAHTPSPTVSAPPNCCLPDACLHACTPAAQGFVNYTLHTAQTQEMEFSQLAMRDNIGLTMVRIVVDMDSNCDEPFMRGGLHCFS